MDDNKPSLADEFFADTYRLGRLIQHPQARRDLEPTFRDMRIALRKSNRFTLDDEFTRYATQVSIASPLDKLMNRFSSAVVPYEHTWIEFNLRAKVQTAIDIGTAPRKTLDGVPERMGLMFQRLADSPTGWQCMMVSHGASAFIKGQTVAPIAPVMCFDSNCELADKFEIRHRSNLDKPDGYDDLIQAMWGWQGRRLAEPFFGSTLLIYSPVFAWTLEHMGSNPKAMAELVHHMNIAVSECRGMLRWVVTVLGMLSEVPLKATDRVQPPGRRLVNNIKREYMDFHRLTLKLPKVKPIPYIERKLDRAADRRHRAHEVRSHWRTYVADELSCRPTEHNWTMKENGYRECSNCKSFGRLIREHQRGDPSLGWVRKEYVIEKGESYA